MFRSDCSAYKPDMLLFIDENGTDRRHSFRKFGYSLVGKPALPTSLHVAAWKMLLLLLH